MESPSVADEHTAAFRSALEQTGIVDPVAHTSYLINLGSPDDALWRKSIDALAVEVERCAAGDFRPRRSSRRPYGSGEKAGVARIAKGLDRVHRLTKGLSVIIDLETTAGQGTSLGYRFEHLGDILKLVAHPERFGVCADTCHIFAAGYSLATRNSTMRLSTSSTGQSG